MIDYRQFTSIDRTWDGSFTAGKDGVREILTPADRKSEFIRFENKTVVSLKSGSGLSSLYMLPETRFEPKAEAVLMDLDGTSVTSESFWIWIIQSTTARLLGKPDFCLEEEDIPFVSGFSVSEHLQYCIDKYCPGESLEKARNYYHEITDYEMGEILAGRGKKDAFTPAPGLKEFLYALKDAGVRIGLVTSGLYRKAMPEILSAFRQLDMGDPLSFYDAIITAGTTYRSDRGGTLGELCAKPHPWLYAETALVGLNTSPERRHKVIGIEDSGAGALAIKLAGYEVVGVEGGNIAKAGLDGILYRKVPRLTDILEIIL
ncbi:MAG: HAD hydrolase-like protein [Eubacteriales bacterium]|nr:HAD hydrolase-like protein [Eubacteriales bacterium]